MRSILPIIALFSLCTLRAQGYIPSTQREAPRSEVIAYPTEGTADTLRKIPSRYLRPLTNWTQEGTGFSAQFAVPFAWLNREILLRIASASGPYDLLLNGNQIAYNADGNTPAEFNLTRVAKEDMNTLTIRIHTSAPNAQLESWKGTQPPALGEVYVQSQPMIRIREVLTRSWESEAGPKAEIGLVVKTGALNPKTTRIYYEVRDTSGMRITSGHQDITLDMRREDTMRMIVPLRPELLWSTDSPLRYTLRVKTQVEGRYAEYLAFDLGFRSLTVKDGRLTINGRPETLRMREVAPTISAAEIAQLKASGYNTLRLSAGTVPPSFYEICDTTGIYVIAQAPIDTRSSGLSRRKGGSPSNDPEWLEAYIERTQDNYYVAKRHPSVIAFSLANSSANGINLYESYLNMKYIEHERPIIYLESAGEWNSDKLLFETNPKPSNP